MTDDAAASALSSEQSAELHQWGEVLTGIGAAWSATAGQLRDMPALDCPARREDALLAAAHPGWHTHEAFHAGLDAVGLIDAAARHISGLRSLAADHNLVLTPWPLTRAVVEHITHAGWLLDPEITAEQRVARRWMAKLANAYRYRWFASVVRAAKTDVKAIKRGRDQVRAELARRFPDADLDWSVEQHPNGPPWVVAGQRYPGLAEATRRFTEYGGIHGVPGLYDLLSLTVHPNLHTALASILQPTQHDGFIQYNYRVDFEQTIRLLRLATVFLYHAGSVVCSFFSLNHTALEGWADTLPPTAATARPTCAAKVSRHTGRRAQEFGHPRSPLQTPTMARQLYAGKAHTMEQIAEIVRVSRATVYRHLEPSRPRPEAEQDRLSGRLRRLGGVSLVSRSEGLQRHHRTLQPVAVRRRAGQLPRVDRGQHRTQRTDRTYHIPVADLRAHAGTVTGCRCHRTYPPVVNAPGTNYYASSNPPMIRIIKGHQRNSPAQLKLSGIVSVRVDD